MQRNRKVLFLVVLFMTLGSGMYGIFLPIYFLELGFPLKTVLLSCAVFYLGGIIAGIFSNMLMKRFGIRFFFVFRGIAEPIFIILVRNIKVFPLPIEAQFRQVTQVLRIMRYRKYLLKPHHRLSLKKMFLILQPGL